MSIFMARPSLTACESKMCKVKQEKEMSAWTTIEGKGRLSVVTFKNITVFT